MLERHGFEVEVRPFTDEALFALIHEKGKDVEKASRLAIAAVRRLRVLAQARRADIVVLHREAFPFGPPLLERALARSVRRLVFSFDDALYAPYPYSGSGLRRVQYRLKYRRNLGSVMSRSTAVIAGNETLAAYARQFSQHVQVIPTAVDTDNYPVKTCESDGAVTIGWLGSPSTSVYLKGIEPSLKAIEERHGSRVRFRFIGDAGLRLDLKNLEVLPWRQGVEISDLLSFDIGIMPLLDSEWTRGKCAFKAVQYMAVGIPVVASPIGAAVEAVIADETGYLARSGREWFADLNRLVQEPTLRLRLGANGRSHAERRFSTKSTLPMLVDVLENAGRSSGTRI